MVFPGRRRDSPSGIYRPEWYDRNPVRRGTVWVGTGVAPHAVTTRGSYTVPTGKNAHLSSCILIVRRATAPTTALAFGAQVLAVGAYTAIVQSTSSSVGGGECAPFGYCGVLRAGATIELQTFDNSTGGTVDYVTLVSMAEFGA